MLGASVRRRLLLASGALLVLTAPAEPQTKARFVPRLESVAETRLLMQGISLPNFRGLERHLRTKPADEEAWTFARGQALLLAENGNLLLLRPPRNAGEPAWLELAVDLRSTATRLARATGAAEVATLGHGGLLSRDSAYRFPPYRKSAVRGELSE